MGKETTDAMKLLPIILLAQGFTELTDRNWRKWWGLLSEIAPYDLRSVNSSQNKPWFFSSYTELSCLNRATWMIWDPSNVLQNLYSFNLSFPQHSILGLDANIRLKSSLLNHGLWTKLQMTFVPIICWAINCDFTTPGSPISNSQSFLTFSILGEPEVKHDPFSSIWQPLQSQLEFDTTRQHNSRFVNIHFKAKVSTMAGQQGHSLAIMLLFMRISPVGLGQGNNSASQKWPTTCIEEAHKMEMN